MIHIEHQHLSPKGRFLHIGASILDKEYYSGVSIRQVIVDTDKTYTPVGPSAKPFISFTYGSGTKSIDEVIDVDSFGDSLFFVYIIAEGTVGDGAPCDMKSKERMTVVYDERILYREGAGYIGKSNHCTPSDAFVDFIIRNFAFRTALLNCNYVRAIELWKDILGGSNISAKTNCGCHG